MKIETLTCLLVLVCFSVLSNADYDVCKLSTPKGNIDLNKLRSKTGYYAVRKNTPYDAWVYFIQICDSATGFPEYETCNRGNGSKAFEYGTQTRLCEPMTAPDDKNIRVSMLDRNDPNQGALLTYTSFTFSGLTRIVNIQVVCDPKTSELNESSVTFVRLDETLETNQIEYYFRIYTDVACPTRSAGMAYLAYVGVGGSLLVACLVGLAGYFAFGSLFNKLFLKKEGKKIVPHYSFWSDLPFLVRDGFLLIGDGIRVLDCRRKEEEIKAGEAEEALSPVGLMIDTKKRAENDIMSPTSPA